MEDGYYWYRKNGSAAEVLVSVYTTKPLRSGTTTVPAMQLADPMENSDDAQEVSEMAGTFESLAARERNAFEAGWEARHDAEYTLSAPREMEDAWADFKQFSDELARRPTPK